MTSCCRSGPCEEMFSPRMARRSLERYRKRGLDDIERGLVAAATGAARGARVLEIGGGIGAVQAELLEAGASEGEVIELVAAYEPYALELARDKGLDAKVTFRVADVLDDPESVERADVVVLNRVVCCTPDCIELAGVAASLTRQTLVMSFPRKRLLVRAGLRLLNLAMFLIGRSFRVFVHPRAELVAAAEAAGLSLVESDRRFAWELVALHRPA